MPIFEYNGKKYNVKDEHIDSFMNDFPDASTIMEREGKKYRVRSSDYNAFMSELPATRASEAQTPGAMSAQMPAGQKQTMAKQSEQEYVEGFGEGFKQGWQGLVSGSKYLVGEVANAFSGSSENDKNALGRWDELQKRGVDIAAATDMKKWGEDAMVNEGGTLRALTQQEKRDYETIQEAIQEAGGDLDKARKLMEQRAKETTWGDSLKKEAADEMNQMKPTKGFGAWVGNLAPQMIPSAAALALAYFTKNPKWAKMVGNIGMAGMTASTAGSTMKEARDAGASDMQVWGAGVADGTIEYLTEKLPFDKLTNRIFGNTKKKLSREIAEGLADNPQTREEMERLLGEAANSVGLNWKQVGKSVLAQATAEGLSEAAAGTLQTATQMIYQEPENYPTLYDYVTNAWEGAKAGMFMGAVLGAPVPLAQKVQNDKRRKQQGEVYVAGIKDKDGNIDVVEVVGSSKDGQLVIFGQHGYGQIKPEDVAYAHTFSYQEFKTGELQQEFDNGYDLETPQEMTDAKNMYEMQRQRVADALGEEVLADIDNDPEAAIGKLGEDERTNQTVLKYLNAKMVYDGMNKRVADDADARIAESDALVDAHTHKKTGMVQGAVMKENDRKVYIVNGNVVPLQDGTGIDLEASDNSIIIRDAESGELEQVSPEVLLNVDAALDPTAEKQAAREAIESEVRANAERMQNGVVGFAPGDVYTVLGEDGNTHQVEIVQDNGDDTVTANVDGEAVEEVMTKEQIQNEVDAYNRQRVVLVVESAENADAAKPNYELNAHVTLQTPEGVVTGNINQAENDDNLIEVQVNKPFGGKKTVDMYTREELDNMVVEVADENGNVIWSKPAENAEAAANVQGAENMNTPAEGGAENVNTAPAAPIVRGKHDQIDAVESIKAGTTPQQMADAYMQEYGDEEGLPLSTAQENLAQVQEERQKTKDVNLKNGPLRKQEKFWSEVVDLLTPKEETVAVEGRQETVGTPVALQYLLEGGKGSIENAGYFFYAIQAAFPHIGAQLQEIRNSMPAEMLGLAPDAFVASNPSQLQEVRGLVEATYGEAGTRILGQMLANSTGFYPREGKALDLEIENLKPVEGNEQAQEAMIVDPTTMSDEEKHRRGDMLRNAPAVDVQQGVISSTPEMSARKAAEKWWDENVDDALMYNTEVGEVEINKNSIESSLAHRYGQRKLDAITSLVEGFENAVYLGTLPDSRERGVVDHYFAYPINYNGERCYVFCRAMQDANKNRLYVHEVFVEDRIKKGDTLQTAASKPHGGIALYKDILANVLDAPSEGKGTDKSVTAEGTQEEISENAQNATQSEQNESANEQNELEKAEKERIDALVPTLDDVTDGTQTADEFVAGLFGNGIRITSESFRKETGLGWEEQRRLVGIIAGKEKGGLTVEQAAETIVENYRTELAERGFSGDSMEMRDMVIDILSSGNPRAYAKQAAARRAEQALHREMEAFDRYTQEAFHMSAEEYIMYEESMLPKYIEQYKDFDEQEYYSNFADEQSIQNEHDTTRESAETGGSREILSEEQPSATPGEGTAGEGQQGGTLQGDVQGNAQEGLARAEAENILSRRGEAGIYESLEGTKQLTDEDISSLMSLMEGNATPLPVVELNPTNWMDQFGESGMVQTPVGMVKMGANQIAKLFEKGRSEQFGMIKPTLEAPHIIIEIPSVPTNGVAERESSLLFVRTFSGKGGKKIHYFKSVTVKKDGLEVSVSSHYDRAKRIKSALKEGKLLYRFDGGAQTEHHPADVSVTASPVDMQGNSGYKDTDNPQNNTNKQGVISENAGNAKSGVQTGRTRFSTSVLEDAERIAREEQRRAPLRRTARAWEKILGVKVTLMERLEDVKNPVARREIEAAEKKGKKVPGWYSDTEGVFLYLPHVENEKEVDNTCVHEIVSHKGLKELLGQEKFDELCRKVWGIMSPAARKKYRNYPNVHNELQAADEYIAHLSEEVELTARERSVWQKIMDFIAGLLGRKADNRSKAASIVGKETLSRKDIAELVRLSYAEYLQRNGTEKAKPVGKGYFGEVYDQFKGKPKEAADFLLANKGGDLLGVFNRSGIGEIDAVWGDTTGGVAHIIDKHVGEGKSFKSLSEAFDVISDVIRNGNIIFQNGDKIIFHKGGNKVSIRKNIREKGKKIAEKNWILTAYDENAGDNTSAISDVNQGKAAPTPANSAGKDTAKKSTEQGNGMKFRVTKNNLVAVHNISEENLRRVFEMGGLIMPSIAITDVNMGHSGYGEISLLFDKETVNPTDRRNKVYGGDAWTPRFPQMVPKLNGSVLRSVKEKIYSLLDARIRELYNLSAEMHPDNIEKTLTRDGVSGYYGKEYMKIAYLLDKGKRFKIPMKEKDYGSMAETIIRLARENGLSLMDIKEGSYEFFENNPEFVAAVQEARIEQKLANIPAEQREQVRGLLLKRPIGFNLFDTYISQALSLEYDLEHGGKKQIVDRAALYGAINRKAKTDNADYDKWVDELFEGVVEKYGIRNNRDWYTPSGNSRPWEQLYDAATPANILRHMLAENEHGGSGGFFDSNIMGASAERYESIEEIREKGKKRLKRIDDKEYLEWSESIANRLSEICDEFMSPSQKDEFGGSIDAKIAITNAVAKDKSAKGIYKEMKKEYPRFSMEHAKRVEDVVKEIQNQAIGYFEAKPQRIVPLSEVRTAVVPSNVSSGIVEELEKNGVEVATYRKGNEQSRQRVVKKESNGIRFRVSNDNQEIFVSNAQRAVEGIKQEKGTPQQWLAMIEKNGGLKAGEDKWLGLSDWLKGTDKKSVTKQEILDFIGENKIRIEEVTYGEEAGGYSQEKLDEFNAEYEELIWEGEEETGSIYANDWADYAYEAMADRYGEDFRNAFDTDGIGTGSRLVPHYYYDGSLSEEAKQYIGDEGANGNEINSTRLEYTTEGLDNKQEIALTVPTIEPWNQSDDIHFGDAGGGRAVAWIRFGETVSPRKVQEVKRVEEFAEPYRDVNGHDVYKPKDNPRSKDFIVSGMLKTGNVGFVVFINEKQVPVAYNSLEEAIAGMNQYYREHPVTRTVNDSVLVIDEIQSKRHQEGREKGYKQDYIVKGSVGAYEKVTDNLAYADVSNENGIMIGQIMRQNGAYIALDQRRQRIDFNRYNTESEALAVVERNAGIDPDSTHVPSAPFEKNWHELAMKRMLRYAAENGFDKVAWTTGAQQAERYNLGKYFSDIEREDNPHIEGRRFVLHGGNVEALHVDESGNVIESTIEEAIGKPLVDVVGKSMADRMMSMDNGDMIEGEDLRIGGEGMKGFYDKMLPSFVQKYTKKWGAKVGEVELPHLEEGAQKMWSVDVTPEMKESVMEGQTMFRVTDDIEEANARFNEELQQQIDGTLPSGHVYQLGMPSDVLRSTGVPMLPIMLQSSVLARKANDKNHPFELSDVKNLVRLIQKPIAIFEYGDKSKAQNLMIGLSQADSEGKQFLVGLSLNPIINGRVLEINSVRNVFPKNYHDWIHWINQGKMLRVDNKEEIQNIINALRINPVDYIDDNALDSAAKVIKDFQNPSVGGGIRFRSVDKLRERYDKMVRLPNKIGSVKWYENLPYRLREAYQDSMLSLKVLQDVILEETGNTMTSGENAYMAENQMSSKNKAEAEMYERDFFKPMMEEVKNLLAAGATYDEVQKYLFAKHGLERNMEMYKKNKQEAIDKWIEERTEQLVKGGMTQADARAQAQQDIALYPSMSDSELDKQYRRDYSGLTALTEKDNVTDAEAEATQMVSDFEGRFSTAGLWDKINAATRETLRKSYDSGMMDKATYEKINGMYHYYIPLRGWDADVAGNEYEYLSDRGMNLSPVLVKTKGRTSLADDPIATIGFMAEGTIVQGNRNLMKQRFMNFVLNNPTSLVSVSKQWYVWDNAQRAWVPNNPVIPTDATGDQVAAIVEQHEQEMLSLGKKAKTKRAGLKLGLHATKQEGQEHMVRVKRGGKEYCLYINGSPRAAQALNGMTNPDASNSSLYKAASAVKNFMARMFTSQNPAFVVSNLSRDLIWAGTAVAVRENKDYAARYTKNVGKAFKNATLPKLLHKYQNGTLDMNVEEERLFMEFIKHGGETGFTQITSVEDYKKDIKRFVKEVQSGKSIGKKAWDGFFDTVEFLNRSAEDTTRFMVYMTSRQMGRDVATSVSDAKEITVNFNKKGSGGLGANVMNFCYIFFNAAIQSLSGFGKMMAEHPKRTLSGLAAYAAAGVIVPAMSIALQALTGDDDDESYWDLPEWIRRNNLVLYVPLTDSGFITIPLPHELRPFYAMGEIALSAMCGREDVADALRKVAMNFAEMLPLDFTGNGGNLAVNLTPTTAQPVAQIIANKDYTGKPIYKNHEWNKRDPEWTKAYKGTSPWIVEGTKWLNRFTGGDDVKSGGVDWNPALIEHVLESYTGGAGKTFNRTVKTFQMMWDEDMRQWRNVPVISSFVQSGDERIQGSDVNNRYYEAYDEFEDTKHLLSGYKKQKKEHKPGTAGYVEYARKLDELMNSDEYKRYKVFKGRQKAIKKVSDKLKETDDRDRIDSLNTRLMQLKEEMLEELEKADDSPKP